MGVWEYDASMLNLALSPSYALSLVPRCPSSCPVFHTVPHFDMVYMFYSIQGRVETSSSLRPFRLRPSHGPQMGAGLACSA